MIENKLVIDLELLVEKNIKSSDSLYQGELKPIIKKIDFINNIIGQFCKKAIVEKISSYAEIENVAKKYNLSHKNVFHVNYFYRNNITDIQQMDLVIIISDDYDIKKELSRLLINNLLKNRHFGKFTEIPSDKMPEVDLIKYPHFLNNYQNDRVFFYDGFFMCLNMIGTIPFLSYINFGSPKNFFKGEANELLEYIHSTYGYIGFCWSLKGTGTWLRRLSKRYKNKKEFTKDNINYMILSNNIL